MGTNKGFTGQYADVTGLDYYNARYYDPVAGVFLSPDTVQGNAKGMNPYGYVGGNPETKNDPTGQMIVGNNGNFGYIAPDGSLTIATNAYAGWVWDHLTPTEIHRPIYNPNTDSNNSPLAKFEHMTGWTDFQHVWNDPHASWQDKLSALWSLVGTNANNLVQLAMILGGGEEEGAALGGKTIVQDVADLCGGGLSFTADTKVATAHGEQPIGKLHVGDKVWAYNPTTQKMELETIRHVWLNHDHDLVDLTVATTVKGPHGKASQHDEVIHTNERHPFLAKERGFVPVSQLTVGMHIRQADGLYGVVAVVRVVPGAKWMYNLEVAQDHTFTVGEGQWVVHNSSCWDLAKDASDLLASKLRNGEDVSAVTVSNVSDVNGNVITATNGSPGETAIGGTSAARSLWGGCCAETHIAAQIVEALRNGGTVDGEQILLGMQHVNDIGPCGNCVSNLFALARETGYIVKLSFFDGLSFNVWTFTP